MISADVVEYRPGFGRGLALAVGALCAVVLGGGLLGDASATLRYAPVLALVGVAAWAAYWRPAVVVSPAGVELRNVTRTIVLPWPSIERIETKYALTLHTAYGAYAAWAAPAPSRSRTLDARPDELAHLPETSYGPGGAVRPGDLAGTGSGQAAALIRWRWEELRDAGHLDDPVLERNRPRVRWHYGTLSALAVLTAASVLAGAG